MTAIQAAIGALVDRGGIEPEEAAAALETIMSGDATEAQIGAFLAGMRLHGETPEVVAACWAVMERHAEPCAAGNVVDLCGTGGDGADTFNVSTAAGFVVAGAGGRVAKHGNRAASSNCGSADLLEALGARIDLGGEAVARVIEQCGFGFLFAQRFHPAMRHVGGPRREMGTRTIFNVLGPISNPAQPRAQLTGVGSAHLGPLFAEAFRIRGLDRAVIVHSEDGLDEISPATATHAWILEGGEVREEELTPATFGLEECSLDEVAGGTPEENAATLRAMLAGQGGPVADFVTLNAAAGCWAAGLADSFAEGAALARQSLASGRARVVAESYVRLTQEVS